MKQKEELLRYDDMGIVPFAGESKWKFLKRAGHLVASRDELVNDLQTIGYSSAESKQAGLEFILNRAAIPDKGYQTLIKAREETAYFTGFLQNDFPYLRLWGVLPLVALAEYYLYGSMGMGVPFGFLAKEVGVHTYRYVATSRALAQQQQQAKQRVNLERMLLFLYKQNANYIQERLDTNDEKVLTSCYTKEDFHKAVEQLPGLKWHIMREHLRLKGIPIRERPRRQWQMAFSKCTRSIGKSILATLCSTALFFETTFGYKDYVIKQRDFSQKLMTESTMLIAKMQRENNITFSTPRIRTGYRALHHELAMELQQIVETNSPLLSSPGIRQVMMIYTYTGAGFGAFLNIRGLYSAPSSVTVTGDYEGSDLTENEKYIAIHEFAHHYINTINPRLLSHALSRKGLEDSAFHEGLAEYIAIRTLKARGIMQYHRCIYASDVAKAISGNGSNLLYHKTHHYSLGYGFVDYVLSEVGEKHLEMIIKTPPTFSDFILPGDYVLSVKRKLGQTPVLLHPEKNPAYILEKYIGG